jgi:hypothetical protein
MRYLLALLLAVLWIPSLWAESKDCNNPTLAVADGRVTNSAFEAAPSGSQVTYWYAFSAQAGHSYSVEFVPTTDNEFGRAGIRFADFNVFAPSDPIVSCRGQSSLALTANSAIAPAISREGYGTGRRVSFIQSTPGVNRLYVSNDSGAGAYSYRIVDTTLFGPHWSTWNFETQWGFLNSSDMTITGTFSVYDTNGVLVRSPVQVTIPAGGIVFRQTHPWDLAVPRNSSGFAIFAHNGPPHAIVGDAYMMNGPGTVVIPAKFETRGP